MLIVLSASYNLIIFVEFGGFPGKMIFVDYKATGKIIRLPRTPKTRSTVRK
jgi:hypothetical protein